MIRQMLAWGMSWRSRTASFIALCAILGVLAGIFAATRDQVQAQTAGPILGTLIAKVPRGSLPGGDHYFSASPSSYRAREHYWVYVNGQIVSAPPYGPFVREQSVFESYPIQLAPGQYVVELLTLAAGNHQGFPFAIARTEVQVAAGKTKAIELGIPTGTSESFSKRLQSIPDGVALEQVLESLRSQLTTVVQDYEADPIVPVLNDVLLNLSVTPPSQSSVFANLPDSMGGGRELDATQVSLIIQKLEQDYKFASFGEFGLHSSLRSAAPPIPQLAAQMELQIGLHNKRIDDFRQIVKALEQVKGK